MPVFSVYVPVTTAYYLGDYTAASAEEAIEAALAESEGAPSLCHQCVDKLGDQPAFDETRAFAEIN